MGGENVRRLQLALKNLGFEPGPVDTVYGPLTADAVRRFQKQHGLQVDGIVGPETWNRLSELPEGAALEGRRLTGPLFGATGGEDVMNLQLALRDLGHNPGKIDGVYGPDTERAVIAFQRSVGLPRDGLVGAQTRERLAAALRRGRGAGPVVAVASRHDRAVVGEIAHELGDLSGGVREVENEPSWHTGIHDRLDRAGAVLLCLSPAFPVEKYAHSAEGQTLIERARAGKIRLVPVVLVPTPWSSTPFGDFQAAQGASAISESTDSSAAIATLVAEVRRLLDRVRPDATTETALTGPLYAGYSPDSVAQQDELGVQDLVDVLCSVLAAENLEPPLALGLFGPWGSGKSFFMRQMQRRIQELADRSLDAVADAQATYYCTHIRQVDFNAWLYSDSDLWPSLAAEVFRGVAGIEPASVEASGRPSQQQPSGAAAKLHVQKVQAEAEKQELQQALDQTTHRLEELEELARSPDQPSGAGDAVGAAPGAVGDNLSLGRRLARGWREASTRGRLAVGSFAMLGVGLVGLAIADPSTATRVSAAVGSVIAVGSAAGASLHSVNRIFEQDRARQREWEERQRLEARRATLKQQLQEKERHSEEAGAVINAVSANLVLPLAEYADEQVKFWSQQERVGVVTEIRRRFLRLSDFITKSRAARRAGEPDPAPLDRVIVYVDDLDRCPADVVVHVLEAIKLLMDLPHFVVVVGVDPRWLYASLEQWLYGMAASGQGHRAPGSPWTATPEDYLEKIFQYSVKLPPMTSGGYARLVTSLFRPPPAPEGTDTPDGKRRDTATTAVSGPDVAGPDGTGQEAKSDGGPDKLSVDDLTPTDLLLSAGELTFMSQLGWLIRTPRSAKRLTNVYRLLRVAVGEERLVHEREYEIVLALLAAVVGAPRQASQLFRDIDAGVDDAWQRFTEHLPLPVTSEPEATVVDLQAPLPALKRWAGVVDSFAFHPWPQASA